LIASFPGTIEKLEFLKGFDILSDIWFSGIADDYEYKNKNNILSSLTVYSI